MTNGKPIDDRKKKIRELVVLWQLITVGAIALIGALTIWHLKRRASLVKSRLSPPKMQNAPLELPEPERPEPL